MQIQGCTSNANIDIANAFAEQFSSVYGQSDVSRSTAVCFSQLENEVSQVASSTVAQQSLKVEMIEEVINSMKLGKACGPNNLSVDSSAMQYYGRLRFPMGTCDFWTPPTVTP
jgi:hypothetical protein